MLALTPGFRQVTWPSGHVLHILQQPKVAGFLPLGALTPCKLHDASQKLEPDDHSGRRLCLCRGLSEVPKGCVCCPRPCNSLPVSLPCRDVPRRAASRWLRLGLGPKSHSAEATSSGGETSDP